MTSARRSLFLAGAKDTIPMALGALPFAVIFGALAIDAGISAAGAIGMSLFVFAGSSQFIAVGLVEQGAGLAVLIMATLVVNLRHVLYSASLAPLMKHLPQRWLLPLAFWLTDETYAVVIRRYQGTDHSPHKHWYHFGSSIFLYTVWNFGTVVGVVTGQRLQGLEGLRLDFALVVTFTGIVVPLLVTRPMLLCATVAGITAVLGNNLPNKMGLMLAAVLGIAAGMLAERVMQRGAVQQSVEVEAETS